jgi:hypothetical protein
MKQETAIVTSLLILVALTGCVALQPLPHAARSGDTITLALGSVEGMTKSNVTVTYTSDSGAAVNLTPNISGLFRMYPSRTSRAAYDTDAATLPWKSGHEAWMMVMAVNLPSGMPVGTGKIRVQCQPQASCVYPWSETHINSIDIAFEVLPGQGSPNPLVYKSWIYTATGSLSDLEEGPQLAVRTPYTPFNSPYANEIYGAVQVVLYAPVSDPGVNNGNIRVVTENMDLATNSQLQTSWKRVGDYITVYLVSPIGMRYFEPRFSVVLRRPYSSAPPTTFTATPRLESAIFYSLDGSTSTNAPPVTAQLFNS